MYKNIPKAVAWCCAELHNHGHQAHPVGGCVRDLLLGRVPQDWDIATSATPEVVQKIFPKTVATGIAHGTVTVIHPEMTLEVTTFRRELGYGDGRRPDKVVFDVGLTEDLSRRDFTVNAMALDVSGGVIDPFSGQQDLKKKIIRCVGDPIKRFQEDGLRILRGIRFCAQLGFSLERETQNAMTICREMVTHVSAERLRHEVEKILLSDQPQWMVLVQELGILAPFGGTKIPQNWDELSTSPLTKLARWQTLCRLTELDITKLPVERTLRRGVLHPEVAELAQLMLSGGALYEMGLRGGQIGEARRALLSYVAQYPEDNTEERLVAMLPSVAQIYWGFYSESHQGYALLEQVLRRRYGLEQMPPMARQAGGKPYFPSHPELYFNLSHSGNYTLCVVGSRPVGVDIEVVRPRKEGLPQYALTPKEHQKFLEDGGTWSAFYRQWTAREAWCKYTGQGVAALRHQDIPSQLTIRHWQGEHWQGAVCTEGEGDIIFQSLERM